MRIGLVCQTCDRRTGIGRIVNSLSGEFIELGNSVVCAAQFFDEPDERIEKRPVPHLSASKGVNKLLFRLNGSPFGDSEVDIIHTFGVGRGAHVVSAQSCHLAGMELLPSKKNQFCEHRNLGLYDRISLSDERFLLTSSITRKIIAVSQLVKSQILERYEVDADRIVVIPNGVDVEKMESLRVRVSRSDLRTKLGYSDDDLILLFVGNEFARKGLSIVLKAIAALQMKDLRLLVVGAGDRDTYGQLAVNLGITDAVKFIGSISNPETMFLAADAFVFPSLYEPFGIVVLEAMAAGVPVITSRACGATEGMEHRSHVFQLDDPTSVEELSEAIMELMRSESLRSTLSRAGEDKAKEFSWETIAPMILAVYDDVRGSL